MAIKPTDKSGDKTSDGEETSHDVRAPDLDDKTHTEMCMLYRESTDTLRFVKMHQWKTVGATLMTYFGLIIITSLVNADKPVADKFIGIIIVLCCAVIFTLVIYQFWMQNELLKINYMQPMMSSLFKEVRAKKSPKEGNFHRYMLLAFMIIVVVLGAVVANISLGKIAAL